MSKPVHITIFTPTYNRGKLLPKLYESLLAQECHNFEWLIVDDGSIDDTEQIVQKWIDAEEIPIVYIKKENGGKHTAMNIAAQYANGYLFSGTDSDDYLTPNATALLTKWAESVSPENKFSGVAGTSIYPDGKMIGSSPKGKFIDADWFQRRRYDLLGDKSGALFTSVLREFPFPIFEDETFMTEDLMLNRIAANGYRWRWYNDPLKVCEYRNDGLSSNVENIMLKNPKGYSLYIKELLTYKDVALLEKIKATGVYCYRMKNIHTFSEISRNLDISIMSVFFLYFITSVYRFLKKE